MNAFNNALERTVNFISTIGVADVIDILIVAYLIYQAIKLIRKTNSYNLAKGLIIFVLALWLSALFKLTMINFILRKATELGFIALVVLFQPELRRLLEKLGSRLFSGTHADPGDIEGVIRNTVLAVAEMARQKTGALIVFERDVKVNDVMATGTEIDAEVSDELLKNLFYNKAPLHDGAVVIRDGRIAGAGCVLPLTKSTNLSKDLGMRHRAGLGLSESSDAIVVIVSEETGAISCAIDGMLKRHLSPNMLEQLLKKELTSSEDAVSNSLGGFFRLIFKVKTDEEREEKDS